MTRWPCQLLHLNPMVFKDEIEVFSILPELLRPWNTLSSSGIRLQLQAGGRTREQDHWIRKLSVEIVNDSNQRITTFNGQIRLPSGILKHWSSVYLSEVKSDDSAISMFHLR